MTPFSLVPRMIGKRRKPTNADPNIFADWPDEKTDEKVIRLRFACESRCALNQDSEAGACDLRCPECGCRGSWESEATGDHLCEPDASQLDLEPYNGRKRVPDESPEVWRCHRGHETKEPLRPRKEPRSGGGRSKAPAPGRNAVEDRLILLCASID